MHAPKYKIGIDFRAVGSPRRSGVENYILQLVEDLIQTNTNDHFYLFIDKSTHHADLKKFEGPNSTIIRIPSRRQSVFSLSLKVLCRVLRLDLLHLPTGAPLKGAGVPVVINIYDLTFERYPEFYAQDDLKIQRQVMGRSNQADAIIAISESTKKDIIKYCQIDDKKIFVTLLQPRSNLKVAQQEASPLPDSTYLLCIGNVQPRKNFTRAVEALSLAKNQSLNLVIAGKTQDKKEADRIAKKVSALKLDNRVRITGYVSDEELDSLYRNCMAVLFPSIYEGFGYPIVEAFSYKAPVITSNTSCMPEIASDAALYCDPFEPQSIADAINKIDSDPQLRASLIKKGTNRLAELNKVPIANQTYEIYKSVIERAA